MKTITTLKTTLFLSTFLFIQGAVAQEGPTAKEIIDKGYQLMRGNSNYAEMTMKIIRPKWERTLSFKTW